MVVWDWMVYCKDLVVHEPSQADNLYSYRDNAIPLSSAICRPHPLITLGVVRQLALRYSIDSTVQVASPATEVAKLLQVAWLGCRVNISRLCRMLLRERWGKTQASYAPAIGWKTIEKVAMSSATLSSIRTQGFVPSVRPPILILT